MQANIGVLEEDADHLRGISSLTEELEKETEEIGDSQLESAAERKRQLQVSIHSPVYVEPRVPKIPLCLFSCLLEKIPDVAQDEPCTDCSIRVASL